VTPGDGAGFAEAIRSIARDPQRSAEMGRNARRMLDRYFSRLSCLGSWEELFDVLARPQDASTSAMRPSGQV
jgi:glycosyltransferase involved in cell wall biosynthesis